MKKRIKEYPGERIVVSYDIARCIHAAECARGLPSVFDAKRRPWVDPDAADPDEIAAVTARCPSGALKFTRTDGGPQEPVPEKNTIAVQPNGPLYVSGAIEILDSDGNVLLADTRVALCRCGHSKNKPLCDGSHSEVGFNDAARLGTLKKITEPEEGQRTLRLSPRENASTLLEGPVTIVANGEELATARCSLCRCGASQNKPFCDGSHKEIEFTT